MVSAILIASLTACATATAPERPDVVTEALPETTEIPDRFSAADDTGEVDDGWIESFGDLRLVTLVDEGLRNNTDLRIAAAQVDRSAGLARLAGSSLKPTVSLGADLSGTSGEAAVSVGSAD